jgi:hypothetical protein
MRGGCHGEVARAATQQLGGPSLAIASASAAGSPTGIRLPQAPRCRISAGPNGQSVLITGVPHPSASISTLPSPS